MNQQKCYAKLWQLKLSEPQLRSNGYPRPHSSIPGNAVIYDLQASYCKVIPGPFRRNCTRCFKVYDIQANGVQSEPEECAYHIYRVAGRPPRHRCCQGGLDSRPCAVAPQHVTEDIDPDNLFGFVTTVGNNSVSTENVYAIDCEMICTTAGMALAGISVVDADCNLVYETMVLPDDPILDYLTEYSNLTEQDFLGVTTRISDVHAKLLTFFGSRTILVGHGMNTDMLWLKLFHDNIVDTCVLYPHAKGIGFRNSLGFLKERYLPSSRGNTNYRKCREDAEAAMKLALMKCR